MGEKDIQHVLFILTSHERKQSKLKLQIRSKHTKCFNETIRFVLEAKISSYR